VTAESEVILKKALEMEAEIVEMVKKAMNI